MSDRHPSFGIDRRAALRLFVSGAALALASCGRPDQEVVPYVDMPERLTPGVPLRFASALPLAGYGRGVIVTSVEGRPIKIDGNRRHPASLGATDVFAEAAVLSLYDPDRSQAPRSGDRIQSWSAFEAALRARIDQEASRHGSGLALLTGRVTSPTLVKQIGDLTQKFPEAKWYRYEPVEDDAIRAGAVQAFGQPLTAMPRFNDARVVLLLDADPLGFGPEQIRFAHDIIAARQSHAPDRSSAALCGRAVVDIERRARRSPPGAAPSSRRATSHWRLPARLARQDRAALPADAAQFTRAATADLLAQRGAAMVLAGPRQPPEVHALCHWINEQLDAPIDYIAPVDPVAMGHAEALRDLAGDIQRRPHRNADRHRRQPSL